MIFHRDDLDAKAERGSVIVLRAACHPKAATHVYYSTDAGTCAVVCSKCNTVVVVLAVAKKARPKKLGSIRSAQLLDARGRRNRERKR